MKTLVAYYSRTGNTKKIGDEVAEALGAEIEELKDRKNRQGLIGYMKSGWDAMRKNRADLGPATRNPADYDLVVLGSPIWAFTICTPTRTYATSHKDSFKNVSFLCTAGDAGCAQKGCDALGEVTGKAPVATLALGGKDISGDHRQAVADFVASLHSHSAAD